MKKIIYTIMMIFILLSSLILTGCSGDTNVQEAPDESTVLSCMKNDSINKSVQGTNLTYYYIGPDDISIYYVTSWKNGVVSLKKYFWNKEQYDLQKAFYSDAKLNDKALTIYVREYTVVEDMDAYWTEIENSPTYTIVK